MNLSKPSIAGLIYILRHEKEWPTDFYWDFSSHRNCALGLISEKWGNGDTLTTYDVAPMLGFPEEDIHTIFLAENEDGQAVKPEDVAARLEAL